MLKVRIVVGNKFKILSINNLKKTIFPQIFDGWQNTATTHAMSTICKTIDKPTIFQSFTNELTLFYTSVPAGLTSTSEVIIDFEFEFIHNDNSWSREIEGRVNGI
jgi:hypothetical protein